MARPSRKTQPYRQGLATRMAGPVKDAMLRGSAYGQDPPMDLKRGTLAKKLSKQWAANAQRQRQRVGGEIAPGAPTPGNRGVGPSHRLPRQIPGVGSKSLPRRRVLKSMRKIV